MKNAKQIEELISLRFFSDRPPVYNSISIHDPEFLWINLLIQIPIV